MRKPDFCICENKDADQMHSDSAANHCLCFRYKVQSLYFLNLKFQASYLPIFCAHTARSVSDLVGNTEDRFCCAEAHIVTLYIYTGCKMHFFFDQFVKYFVILNFFALMLQYFIQCFTFLQHLEFLSEI